MHTLKSRRLLPCLALCAAIFSLHAQAPSHGPVNLDKPEVKATIGKAEKGAGTEWAGWDPFLCEEPRGASPNDPVVEPAKIFDNVYLLGRDGGEITRLRVPAALSCSARAGRPKPRRCCCP